MKTNRILLAIVGLVCMAGGGIALACGLGIFGQNRAQRPLLSSDQRERWVSEPWFIPVVAVGLSVLALIAVAWLLTSLNRRQPHAMTVMTLTEGGSTSVHLRQLSHVLSSEMEKAAPINRAMVRFTGPAKKPTLWAYLDLPTNQGVQVFDRAIASPLAGLRETLGDKTPQSTVLLNWNRSSVRRVQ